MWHLEHSEGLNVFQYLLVFLLLFEKAGLDLECLLAVVDIFKNGIVCQDLRVKVVQVKLEELLSISHLLGTFISLTFIDLYSHHLKFTVSIGSQTSDFLGFPGLFVRLHCL